MTTRELRNEVASFCCADIGEKDMRFIAYANLALRTVYNDLPILGEHTIDLGSKPLLYRERILHEGGKSESLPLTGKSFSMLLVGRGVVILTDENGTRRKSFDSEETAFCGFLSGNATLTMEGEERFYVLSLSTFSDGFGGDPERIRVMRSRNSYFMRQRVSDFHSFVCPPTDASGIPITDAELIDGRINLRSNLFGQINIIYRRLPKRILADSPDGEIDIPESYSELLALLCSYFVLLEDERERAEHFKLLYSEALKSREGGSFEQFGNLYLNRGGWA